MHAPRHFSSLQIAAVGLFALAQGVCAQTATPAPTVISVPTTAEPAPAQTEIAVPSNKAVTESVTVTPTPGTSVTTINDKLDNIVIPEVKLEKATLEDAVSQIRTVVAHLDEATPADKQVSILVDLTPRAQKRVDKRVRLTMDLKAESLRNILGAIAKEAGLQMGVKPTGVTLTATR